VVTAPSSALQPHRQANQPEARALKFAQASKIWLQGWHADRRLSHSDRTLCTQIYLHFNQTHFEKTGELLAWPGWTSLMAKTGLSKTSVFRRLRNLERLGAFGVEHGCYNHETKRRAGNRYHAKKPTKVALAQPWDQGCISVLDQGCTGATRLGDRDSVNLSKKEESKVSSVQPRKEEKERGLPRPSAKEEQKAKPSNSPSLPSSAQDSFVPRAPAPGDVPRTADDEKFIQYDTPEADLAERFMHRATGRPFLRFGRLRGFYLHRSEWEATKALAAAEGAGS
jgi:hypothetical protein